MDAIKNNMLKLANIDLDSSSLYALTVRSPIACGRILSIKAPVLESNYFLVTPQNIPGKNYISVAGQVIPVLAEFVSYRGEPIALLAGPSRTKLEQLLTQLTIEYEERTAHFNYEQFSSEQIKASWVADIGDAQKNLPRAETELSYTYYTNSVEHFYSEPTSVRVAYRPTGLTIYCATQWPQLVRDSVAAVLEGSNCSAELQLTNLGFDFDGKIWYPALLASQAAVLSTYTKKNIILELSRYEDFLYSPKRQRAAITVNLGLFEKTRLHAVKIDALIDVGAYGTYTQELVQQFCLAASSLYNFPNLHIHAQAIATNNLPMGMLGGIGTDAIFFALESSLTRLAHHLGENPIDIRARYFLADHLPLANNAKLHAPPPLRAIVEQLLRDSDFNRKYASYQILRKYNINETYLPLRGVGIALANQHGSLLGVQNALPYFVELTLNADHSLHIVGSFVQAQHSFFMHLKKMASTILDIDSETVTVESATSYTEHAPLSRLQTEIIIAQITQRACVQLVEKMQNTELPITLRLEHRLPAHAEWQDRQTKNSFLNNAAWGGLVIEVEIERTQFLPKVLGVWLCLAVNNIHDEVRVRSMLRVLITSALGQCLHEKFEHHRETMDHTKQYIDYNLLNPEDIPPIHISFVTPAGSEGTDKDAINLFDELPLSLVPSAFLSAISQITNFDYTSLPADLHNVIDIPDPLNEK